MRPSVAIVISCLGLLLGACGDATITPAELPPCPSSTRGHWDPRFVLPGVSGEASRANALARLLDGRVVVGGHFERAVDLPVQNVAAWNGERWSPIGEGLPGEVLGLAVDDTGALWAIGRRDLDGLRDYVARWDGAEWTFVEDGLANLMGIAALDDGVAIHGAFTQVGGVEAHGLAVWNGTWSGRGLDEGSRITALARSPDGFCAGGWFPSAAPAEVRCWTGAGWAPLGGPLAWAPHVLARRDDGAWWVGGAFDTYLDPWTVVRYVVLALDPQGTWIPAAPGYEHTWWGRGPEVRAIAFDTEGVIVGGHFTWQSASGLGRIGPGGVTYVRPGGVFPADADVRALLVDGAAVHVAGTFWGLGRAHGHHVATIRAEGEAVPWADSAYVLGRAAHYVRSLARARDALLVAGAMGDEWNVPAAWFDGTWRPLPSSWLPSVVGDAVVLPDGTPVVASDHVLRWTARRWEPLVDGDTSRSPLLVDGSGYLYLARRVDSNFEVMRWSAGEVLSLGMLPHQPISLAEHEGDLVALLASDDGGRPIWILRDSRWRELPGSPSSADEVVSSDELGLVVTSLAGPTMTWDGAAWRQLDERGVGAIAACRGGLVVSHPTLDETTWSSQLALYRAQRWELLGEQVPGFVTAVVPSEDELFVGAATDVTSSLLRWATGAPPE